MTYIVFRYDTTTSPTSGTVYPTITTGQLPASAKRANMLDKSVQFLTTYSYFLLKSWLQKNDAVQYKKE